MPEIQSQNDIAVIDIGSNSVRLVIYEIYGAHFTPVFNEKVLAGLGRDLRNTGRLSVSGRDTCLKALKRFQRIMLAREITNFKICATAALRVATDASEFLAEIKAQTGWDIIPISGEEEARLSAMGVIASDKRHSGLVADLGGASLELIRINAGEIGEATSLPLGPFEIIGKSLPSLSNEDFKTISAELENAIKQVPKAILTSPTLFLVGGAWRNLAAIHQQKTLYPMRTLQDYALGYNEAMTLAKWAYTDGRETLLKKPGLRAARAETLPYAGLMLERLLTAVKPQNINISISGLREGMVYDFLPLEAQAKDALFDGCRDFAYGSVQAANLGEPLLEFMTPLLETLPHIFTGVYSADPNNIRMAKAASLLAGIGKDLHHDYRPELVFNDVLYAPVAGLTHPERAFLALTILRSYSHKRSVPNNQAIEALLTEDQIQAANILGEIIRLAIVTTGASPSLLKSITLRRDGDMITLSVPEAEKSLLANQVKFRLKRLGKLLGAKVKTQITYP